MRGSAFFGLGWLACALLSVAMPTAAQSTFIHSELSEQRRVATALIGICGDVDNHIRDDSNPEEYNYAVERKIYLAAGVNFKTDTVDSAKAKLQHLWINHQPLFLCTALNFSVPNGNILKYALEQRSYPILEDAMSRWKIDLNYIDPADCRTLLDFGEWKLAQTKGTPLENSVAGIVERLKAAGARHASEVSAADRQRQQLSWERNVERLRTVGIERFGMHWRC